MTVGPKPSVDLSSYNNDWYKSKGGTLRQVLWYFTNAFIFDASWLPVSGLKVSVLRLFGAKVGRGVMIKPKVNIKYPWLLEVGDHVWIGEEVWIDNLAEVRIGSNSCLSQGAMLLCGNHDYTSTSFDLKVGKIILEDGAWVGAKSIVGPGVTVKSHAVLAVGSVATKDLEPYTIYRGNPAVAVKDRVVKNAGVLTESTEAHRRNAI